MFQSIDPTTEAVFHRRELDDDKTVDARLEAARDNFRSWRRLSSEERATAVRALADALRQDKEALALLMSREMGKPITEARGEVDKAAWCFEHYAEHTADYLAPLDLDSDARRSYVQHLPLGTVFGILPWNAPLWLAARCAAPALMAGNSVLIKHDPHVPACAEALAAHAARTLPAGVLDFLFVDDDGAAGVLRDPRVQAASFTGSSGGGRAVAAIAGSEAKPIVLELGGSDPALILADADLDDAVSTVHTSRMINAGQSCIAAKRILVEAPVYDEVVARLQRQVEGLHMGEPGETSTDIGPLAREDLRNELHRQVTDSIEAGARCVVGGRRPAGSGWFYPPTLLADVPRDASAFREETFGPVAAVTRVDDVDDAIALANATPYGLAASIWTEQGRGESLARDIEAGQVAVNGLVKTDPRLPSGGVKRSGTGRELGPHGAREFVNVQQVWVGPGS